MKTHDAVIFRPRKPQALAALVCLFTFTVLPGSAAAAQAVDRDAVVEREPVQVIEQGDTHESDPDLLAEDQEALTGEAVLDEHEPAPPTHATNEAPAELIALAAREPEQFIDKMLVLTDATNIITVGPVLELRQRELDKEPYLIVDATAYFNTPTRYAVAVKDVARLTADRVMMPESAGMHLRGLEYYPEDFTELADTTPQAIPPTEDD